MKALILAGGFGTRLQTVVSDLPKPMAPIAEKPFLAYLLDYLILQGFTEVILSVHYLHNKITDYFGINYGPLSLEYVYEPEPFGTGGAIAFCLRELQIKEPIFILNGDTFLKLDYSGMQKQHVNQQAKFTMALASLPDCSRYGEVIFHDKIITSFNHIGAAKPGLINAGVYLLDPGIFSGYKIPQKFSFEKDFLYEYTQLLKPQGFIAENYFIDIGIPDDYHRAQLELPKLLHDRGLVCST